MKIVRYICLLCMIAFGVLAIAGCGKGADEETPMSEVKAEADKMSVDALKAAALKYKETIMARKAEVEKLTAKIKEIPIAEALGEEAKGLKGDLADLEQSVKALTERFEVYYNQLKEKGADLSGLEL